MSFNKKALFKSRFSSSEELNEHLNRLKKSKAARAKRLARHKRKAMPGG